MEAPCLSNDLHPSLLQSTYNHPPYNVIRNSILNSESYLNEEAKKFIHFAFEEIQIARVKTLQEEKSIVTVLLEAVKCDVFDDDFGDDYGISVKDFFKHNCKIDLTWDRPYSDCAHISITSAVDSVFLTPNFTNLTFENSINGFLIKIKDISNVHEEVRNYIQKIFKNLLKLKLDPQNLKELTVCYSFICKSAEARKIQNIVAPFFKKHVGMDVKEKKIEGCRADCTLTSKVDNPCFLKSSNSKAAWISSVEVGIKSTGDIISKNKGISTISNKSRKTSQLLNEKSSDDCRCILQ